MPERIIQKSPLIYRRMSIHTNMTVSEHNTATREFNAFYRQPVLLGTIPETEENAKMTISEVNRGARLTR
jgi:hypothetical protein